MNPPAHIPVPDDDVRVAGRKRFWKKSVWISLACAAGLFLMGMIGFIASLQAVFFATEEEKLVISKLRPDLTEYEFNIMMSEVFPLTGSILAAVAFVWTVVSVICFLRLRRPTC